MIANRLVAGTLLAVLLFAVGAYYYAMEQNALNDAITRRDVEGFKALLAGNSKRAFRLDDCGLSSMHFAAKGNFPEGIAMLAQAGVSVNATCSLTEAEIEAHKDYSRSEDKDPTVFVWLFQQIEGMTPLHFAILVHGQKALQELIRLGADVNLGNAKKESPLYWAAKAWNAEAIPVLIASGADLKAQTQIGGLTPLHAVFEGFPEKERMYLGPGDLFTWEFNKVYYPLRCAPKEARQKTIKALIDAGADPYQKDLRGQTALDVCPPEEISFHFGHLFPAEQPDEQNQQ